MCAIVCHRLETNMCNDFEWISNPRYMPEDEVKQL